MHARVLASSDASVATAERELDAAKFPIPLPSRVSWARHLGGRWHRTAIVSDDAGRAIAAVGIHETSTRALPGHRIARVEALGDAYAGSAIDSLLDALVTYARATPELLRLVIELEGCDEGAKGRVRDALQARGFARIEAERVSERTIVVDLTPSEDEILAGFGRSTRQNIRGATKHNLALVPLDDPALATRMQTLLDESLARTGGSRHQMDVPAIMAVCRDLPARSRLVGAFYGEGRGAEQLVGFGWGLHHGDRVEYHTGASARIPNVRLPILYPVLWDLITWGKREGGRWFDLGGVTPGGVGSDDALGGISDFKRGFSKQEIALGEEWALEPHPLRARLASVASDTAHGVRALVRRVRGGKPSSARAQASDGKDGGDAPASP